MKAFITSSILIIIMMTLLNCGKDGETGPQGPPGEDGNANVSSTGPYVFEIGGLAPSAPQYDLTCLSNLITQDIVDNGVVICYKKSGSEWLMLNAEQSFNGYLVHFRGSVKVGGYRINVKSFTQDIIIADLNPPLIFRLIIIDSHHFRSHPNVNFNNYEEVVQAFNL